MRGLVVALLGLTGCWAEQRVDDTFSETEWEYLQTFSIDRLAPAADCVGRCERIARFGQQLFFDEHLSNVNISCATCHDPRRYFADPPNPSSFGYKWTRRNVPGLVDLASRRSFMWDGAAATLEESLPIAARAAFGVDGVTLAERAISDYPGTYAALFPTGDRLANIALAIATYESNLRTGPSPFDRYLAGETDAIDDAAKRGAKLFIGKALCSECHTGPLFADEVFHVTGVEQRGVHAPADEVGRAGTGQFRTPTLRHVAVTAPYMHAGQHETLTDVVEFYRWGGDIGGYVGEKDTRIRPLDLTDDDVVDLVAFMNTLTGTPVDSKWTVVP